MSAFLAVLIGLAQVAGPWLCCCRPVAPAPAEAPASVPAKAPKCAHCCPAEAGRAVGDKEPAPAPEPSESRTCCSQVFTVAVPVDSAADSVRALALDGPVLLSAEPAAVAPGLDLSPWAAGAFDSPFLSTAARLYAHHALRC